MTDRDFVLTAVRRANPRAAGSPGPAGEWSTAELLSQIEHRSQTMDTLERRTDIPGPPDRPNRRRLLVAAAAAIALIVAIGVAIALGGGEDENPPVLNTTTTVPEVTTTTAAETTTTTAPLARHLVLLGELNQAVASGDQGAMTELLASGVRAVAAAGSFPPEFEIQFNDECLLGEAGQNCRRTATTDAVDWDGDQVVTGLDALVDELMWLHAQGATEQFSDCTTERQDPIAILVICRASATDAAFLVDDYVPIVVDVTFDLQERTQLTGMVWDIFEWPPSLYDEAKMQSYIEYVRSGVPEPDQLVSTTEILFSPETVDDHKRLIAEWRTLEDGAQAAPNLETP